MSVTSENKRHQSKQASPVITSVTSQNECHQLKRVSPVKTSDTSCRRCQQSAQIEGAMEAGMDAITSEQRPPPSQTLGLVVGGWDV